MAAGIIREEKTILTAEDRTGSAYASMQRNVDQTVAKLAGMQTAMAGIVGGAVVGGFIAMIKSANDAMAAMKDLGTEAGVTASALSRFEEPAKLAGMTLADISSAIQKMSKSMIEAKDPASKAAQALEAFGLSMKDMAGLKPDEMFEKIAKASTLYGNSIEKNAALQELFGRSGSALQKVFAEIADKGTLMATVSDEQAEAADKLGDSIDRLGLRSDQWRRSVASELTPSLQKVIDLFTELTSKKSETGGFFEFIGGVVRTAALIVGGFVLTLQDLGDQFGALAAKAANITVFRGPNGIPIGYAVDQEKNDAIDEARMKRFREYEAALKRLHETMKSGKAIGDGDLDNFSPEKMGKLAANFDSTTKKVKENNDAVKAAEKALRDYVKAAMDALAMDEETAKQLAELDKKRADAIKSTEKVIEQIEFETTLIGLNNDEREKAIALRNLENSGIDKSSRDFDALKERLVAALDKQKQVREEFEAMRQQAGMWDELSDRAGAFFGDLAVNGRTAFDNLRQSLKSFVAELVALFAKKWILNMAGFGDLASSAGAGSLAGSLLSGGGLLSNLGGMAAGAAGALGLPGVGNFIGGLTGSIAGPALPGSALAMGQGAAGMLSTVAPYLAAIAAAYALIKKFGDKGENPKAQLGFGSGAQAYVTQGVFGAEGFRSIQTNDDFNQSLRAYFASFKAMDEGLAKMLTDSQKQRISAALGSASQYEFAFPKGDGTAGEQLSVAYLKSKYGLVFEELDKTFADFVKSFTGSAEDLQKAIADESAVLGLLHDTAAEMFTQIPNLTIDGLRKMQAAGESLSDTFQRVVGEFITAQNNLNAAIGARNPQFARDLVLGQRNNIGIQFASSLGLQYGNDLAMQMALNPQSFGGLDTNQMNLLASWLGLQTTLEQLDAQLAGGTTPALIDFANTVIDTTSAIASARDGLANYLRGSLLSELSPLNPMARYAEAKAQYQSNLTLAQGGNVDAIANFGSVRDQFLNASRAIYASSGQYNTDFFSTFNQGAALTSGAVRPYTAADAQQSTSAIVTAVAQAGAVNQTVALAVADVGAAIIANAQENTDETKALLQQAVTALQRVGANGVLMPAGGGLA